MFSELTDLQIAEWKTQLTAFLQTNSHFQTLSVDGMSVTVTPDNALKMLRLLTQEQKRRRTKGNPFIEVHIR